MGHVMEKWHSESSVLKDWTVAEEGAKLED